MRIDSSVLCGQTPNPSIHQGRCHIPYCGLKRIPLAMVLLSVFKVIHITKQTTARETIRNKNSEETEERGG